MLPTSPRADGRVLVVGWFSLRRGGSATAGDFAARDVVCGWLARTGRPHDVALGDVFDGGVDWQEVDPPDYTHVVHVCGPVAPGSRVTEILGRFRHARLIGVNVSMVEALAWWNPFDDVIERDSEGVARPDLAFAADAERVPVVGVIRVGEQPEYGPGHHARADAAVDRMLERLHVARVPIDTRLNRNANGLRSAAEVESLIARMDVVVTTRLHGLVFALKHGVPAIAIDPIPSGAKVRRQALAVGWPVILGSGELDDDALARAWTFCRSDEARALARTCSQRGVAGAADVHRRLMRALGLGVGADLGKPVPERAS